MLGVAFSQRKNFRTCTRSCCSYHINASLCTLSYMYMTTSEIQALWGEPE